MFLKLVLFLMAIGNFRVKCFITVNDLLGFGPDEFDYWSDYQPWTNTLPFQSFPMSYPVPLQWRTGNTSPENEGDLANEIDPGDPGTSGARMTGKQLQKICGRSTAVRLNILGGNEAQQNEWPWMAALLYKQHRSFGTACGSTLINENFVLTGAHCLYDKKTNVLFTSEVLEVILGTRDILDEKKRIVMAVSEITPHPLFSRYRASNDIGLIKLAKSVKFSVSIQPICLPETPDLFRTSYKEKKAFVVGWGLTSVNDTMKYGGTKSTILREVQVQVTDHRTCELQYRQFRLLVTPKQFCGANSNTGHDVCLGDSGGPAMVTNAKGQFTSIGIISIGHKCAVANYPTIYTRVAAYLPWIKAVAHIV